MHSRKDLMIRVCLTLGIIALAAGATLSTAAAGEPAGKATYDGASGVALWSTCPWRHDSSYPAEDIATCTDTSIFVTESAYREDGTTYEDSYALFIEVTYAVVDGTLVPTRLREGYGPAGDWRVERHLEDGSLHLVVPVRDCRKPGDICLRGQATVETTWEAAGPLIRDSGATVFEVGNTLTVNHRNSLRRRTTAAGTVDGEAPGTHITSLLFSTSRGTLSVCRDFDCLENHWR